MAGGGAIANASGEDYCSIGFAVIRNGEGRLLSARHCFYANGVGSVVRDGVGDRIGVVSNASANGDTVLIDPDASPATIGKVFGGPWNAGTSHAQYQFYLNGGANPAENQDICTSGAVSGQHCNVRADNTGKTFDCALQLGGSCVGFEARNNDTTGVAAAGGDSGGPVYEKLSNGRVGARGIISNTTASPITCGSTSEPTSCYRWTNAVNISWVLNHWNAVIEVE